MCGRSNLSAIKSFLTGREIHTYAKKPEENKVYHYIKYLFTGAKYSI